MFFHFLTATLTSSNIQGASKCEFHFFWNMYGGDIGTLAVHVNTQNPELGSRGKWHNSGGSFKCRGSQRYCNENKFKMMKEVTWN